MSRKILFSLRDMKKELIKKNTHKKRKQKVKII